MNALAAQIVGEATDEDKAPHNPYEGKDPAAVELGRRGRLKGGRPGRRNSPPSSGQRSLGEPRGAAGEIVAPEISPASC